MNLLKYGYRVTHHLVKTKINEYKAALDRLTHEINAAEHHNQRQLHHCNSPEEADKFRVQWAFVNTALYPPAYDIAPNEIGVCNDKRIIDCIKDKL